MKTLLILMALSGAQAQAAPQSPGGGCVWNDARGTCMFANEKDRAVTCDVRIQVTTEKNQKTTKVDRVRIEARSAYHSPEFRSAWGDKIETAQIAARCK